MIPHRNIIVHIAASADGFIAGPGDDLGWLTSRPAPDGFYGMREFMKTVDTQVMGRKTYEIGRKLGETFTSGPETFVFSRRPAPADTPPRVTFVNEDVAEFAAKLRAKAGKHIWLMGGGELIADFLDANAVDEFVVSVVPVFIGEGTPLIARRRRNTPLKLRSATPYPDGLVQLHYDL